MDRMYIRFHFGGRFVKLTNHEFYVGGDIIETPFLLDVISFQHIKDFISGRYNSGSVIRMQWEKFGEGGSNGTVMLRDEVSFRHMLSHYAIGACIDIFVEEVALEITRDNEEIWLGDALDVDQDDHGISSPADHC